MTNGREMTPPLGFSTPPHIPNHNTNERPPVTTTVFAATTPGNKSFAYCASTLTDPTPMISPAFVEANYEILESLLRDRRRHIRNEDLRTELEYFSKDYDDEREMEPRRERTREVTPPLRARSPKIRRQRERVVGFEKALNREGRRTGRNTEGNRPSKAGAEENGRREMNLPPLLAAHLGRNENGQPLQSSLTFVHGGRQSSINIGGNLPPNGTLLSHHAQPFISSSAHVPNGFVPTHANPYSQPSAGIINGQTPSFPFQAQTGNPSVGGTSVYPPQGGYIEDYPLPDGLKMPSHVGSYNGKGDPDNFLHLFEGVIHMQKWLMPVACHMFTYTLKDSARIWWNTQKTVHSIKQREGKSVRAFATRYTDDTLQILGLHEDQHISGFVHGLRTRNLVEHLSTDLSSTYKGLMEKTYTWIEAREVATNGAPNDRKDNFKRSRRSSRDNDRGQKSRDRLSPYRGPNHGFLSNLSKSSRDILAIEKGSRRKGQKPSTANGERTKKKSTTPAEAPILMINQEEACTRNSIFKSPTFEGRDITFPLVTKGSNSSASVVIKAKIFRREVGRVHMDSGSSCEAIGEVLLEITIGDAPLSRSETLNFIIVRSNSPYNMMLGRTSMQKIGMVVSKIHGAATQGIRTVFSTHESDKIGEGVKKIRETSPANTEGVLSCTDAEEKIIVNSKYPEQTVTIEKQLPKHFKERLRNLLRTYADVFMWTHADMTRIPKTNTVNGKPFNTEHKLKKYSHIKPIKQKRRSLGPDRSTAARKKVEELTRAHILREAAHQTWVANPVMVKKSDGGWRMCVDFMDINKACPKDCYPLPEIDWKVESLS
ncbi:hypothetical protein Tco_1003146 [Tanacetum coccineum]|uniref:Retrotransposon gag domain-containing protein n=1 Tax=Tanacetum coccineum TaxID=301880 RepID=A0ABQ5F9Q9_9ASTR